MRGPSLIEYASLLEAFRKIPVGPNLLHYLSQPKTSQSPEKDHIFSEKFYECLVERVSDVTSFLTERYGDGMLAYAPQDAGVVKKKIAVMRNNNRAYELAVSPGLSVSSLEEYARLDPCWSLLFPLKVYLHHHVGAAKGYRGMLPFGGGVIEAINQIWGDEYQIEGRPTVQDHIRLMVMTNDNADKRGMTTIAVNDELYLEGMMLRTAQHDSDSE